MCFSMCSFSGQLISHVQCQCIGGRGKLIKGPSESSRCVLTTMWATLQLFKMLINFRLVEFEKLVALVVPIVNHPQSTCGHYNLASN
jgi:hypothetical protein